MEFQRHLETDETGLVLKTGTDAVGELIYTWLETPVGSRPGYPSWGHDLEQLAFEAIDDDFSVAAEMLISRGVARDIPSANIRRIRVSPAAIDSVLIEILHDSGFLKREVPI